MSIIMMITISSFGQDANLLHKKYKNYYDYNAGQKQTPLSYQNWLINKNYVDSSSIPYDYHPYFLSESKSVSISKTIPILSSGDYLIKAKKQMISGYVFDFIGVGAILVSPNEGGFMVGGACGLIGLICEFSGISNIGKAGVSLNENGIGVKVKF